MADSIAAWGNPVDGGGGGVKGNKSSTGSASAYISLMHARIRISTTSQGVNTWSMVVRCACACVREISACRRMCCVFGYDVDVRA